MGNRDGGQEKRTVFFSPPHFANEPASRKKNMLANGLRYPLVGGTRSRRFDGTSFEPRNLPENAPTPTSRVHAVLASMTLTESGLS